MEPAKVNKLMEWLAGLWPCRCILCGARGEPRLELCRACRAELPWSGHACYRCGEPLTGAARQQPVCGHCLHTPPAFDYTLAALSYQYPVNHLIQQLKEQRRRHYSAVLGVLLADKLLHNYTPTHLPELIIPVPLHRTRLQQRGFNQAYELARRLSRPLALPCRPDLCQRILATRDQKGGSRRQRRRNIHGAFRVVKPLPARRLAIVDDVMTTGATVDELARTLRRAGAEEIHVWCVARTPKHTDNHR